MSKSGDFIEKYSQNSFLFLPILTGLPSPYTWGERKEEQRRKTEKERRRELTQKGKRAAEHGK